MDRVTHNNPITKTYRIDLIIFYEAVEEHVRHLGVSDTVGRA